MYVHTQLRGVGQGVVERSGLTELKITAVTFRSSRVFDNSFIATAERSSYQSATQITRLHLCSCAKISAHLSRPDAKKSRLISKKKKNLLLLVCI